MMVASVTFYKGFVVKKGDDNDCDLFWQFCCEEGDDNNVVTFFYGGGALKNVMATSCRHLFLFLFLFWYFW